MRKTIVTLALVLGAAMASTGTMAAGLAVPQINTGSDGIVHLVSAECERQACLNREAIWALDAGLCSRNKAECQALPGVQANCSPESLDRCKKGATGVRPRPANSACATRREPAS